MSSISFNHIGGVMVSVLVGASAVDRGFDPGLGQTKNYKMCYLLLLCYVHSITKQEQRLVSSESG